MDIELATAAQALQELGARLKRQRLGQNLLQDEVAQRAGISVGALKRLEAGDDVRMLTMLNVARCLGVAGDLQEIFQWKAPVTLADLERQDKSASRTRARKIRSP